MKKRFFLIGAVLTVLLVMAIGTGAVVAQQVADRGTSSADREAFYGDFVARVAELLDRDEDAVRDALETAMNEARENARQAYRDKLEEKLETAVEAGKITQDEADEYLAQFDAKADGAWSKRGFGKRSHGFGHDRGKYDGDRDADDEEDNDS